MSLKILLLAGMATLFFSCASKQADDKKNSGERSSISSRPEWVNDPYSLCKKSSFCSVGEGTSLMAAKASARATIAKIFSAKVKSKFKTLEVADDESSYITASEEIAESTDVELSGVEIIKVFEDDTSFYALAKLHKRKTGRAVKAELDKVDEKIRSIMAEQGSFQYFALAKSFVKRELLATRYQLLTNFSVPSPVSHKDLLKLKRTIANSFLIEIIIASDNEMANIDSKKNLYTAIKKLLLQNHFKIFETGDVLSPTDNITHNINASLAANKAYIKVSGFVRYDFVLTLKTKNVKTNALSNHVIKISMQGRDVMQVKEKAMKKISSEISENFDKINFL